MSGSPPEGRYYTARKNSKTDQVLTIQNQTSSLAGSIDALLEHRLVERDKRGERRSLRTLPKGFADFASNDYLSLATDGSLTSAVQRALQESDSTTCGATGSRLISGEMEACEQFESFLAEFYQTEAALIFPSGYNANLGLLSALGTESSIQFFYDEQVHASIRDGFRLARSTAHKFRHNDLEHLEEQLKRTDGIPVICVEALYSMDGDHPPLTELIPLVERYSGHVIVDEAHSSGVYGERGEGLVHELGLSEQVFARVHTWGKAHGCQGGVIVGSKLLRETLVNFARPFIYTTGISLPALLAARCSYDLLQEAGARRTDLFSHISAFTSAASSLSDPPPINPRSPIQSLRFAHSDQLRAAIETCHTHKLFAVPIFSPTVSRGTERIRVSLHSHNTQAEIDALFEVFQEHRAV